MTLPPAPAADTPQAHFDYGRDLGQCYIAAQGVSMADSDAACAALDPDNRWQRLGFNHVLRNSPFRVQA